MTITEKLSGIVDFLTQGLTRDEDEDAFDFGADEEYVEEGSALRITKPEYSTRAERTSSRETNVVNHPNYRGYEVMIVEPRSFGEAGQMVKHLKDKKTVVLNLHLLDKDQSQRTIDFVCGAAHALEGTAQKVGEMVFIFTPKNVALSVDAQAQSKFAESLWNKTL